MGRKEGWVWHGVYGQWKTAASVAYVLRRQGKETKITQDEHCNATVWKKDKPVKRGKR